MKDEEINFNKEPEKNETNYIIGAEDEKHQEIISKVGERATSDVFKVVDDRTGQVMCKKVIKKVGEESAFKVLQNSMKELDIIIRVRHLCICEGIGYNIARRNTKS